MSILVFYPMFIALYNDPMFIQIVCPRFQKKIVILIMEETLDTSSKFLRSVFIKFTSLKTLSM